MKNSKQNNVVTLNPAAALPARIQFESDYWWLKYTGTREDLIDEGLATPDMFPTGRKRVKRYDDRDPLDGWEVKKRAGELFELRLRAPEPTEAPWEPEQWKKRLYDDINRWCGVCLAQADSCLEKRNYGIVTHRLADRDWYKLQALFKEALAVVDQARVERATVPHLERVK